jgi:acetylornithine deacetylase
MEELARRYLARLVAFDTTSSKSNLECQHWIADTLAGVADSIEWIHAPDEPKANLLIRIGPDAPGGVVLSGHVDVVPVEGQVWTVEPFALTEAKGRLYGRGTTDMKGFDALAMALAASVDKARLKRPLWLAFSYDEEVGCFGVSSLVEALSQHANRPSAVIVGEPSSMRPVDRHKGCSVMRMEVKGTAAHSSSPHLGASAIVPVAKLIAFLDSYFKSRKTEGPFAEGFEPPHSTFNAGRIAGGNALNIIPAECGLDFEFRDVPVDDAEAILRDIRAYIDAELASPAGAAHPLDIRLNRAIWVPSLAPEPDGAAARLVTRLTGFNASGAVPFGTEAGFFQKRGFSTIVCGPGDIARAHQPDEYIEIEEFRAGVAFMEKLGKELQT